MLSNKHVIAALLITPILAVMSYFAVDKMVSEPAHKAEQGENYRLVATSKCRYTSGQCVLKNGNFTLTLVPQHLPDNVVLLEMHSAFPLQGAKLAVVTDLARERAPDDMRSVSDDGRDWELLIRDPDDADAELRLVVAADGALYYGSASSTFMVYETTYAEDFRQGGD